MRGGASPIVFAVDDVIDLGEAIAVLDALRRLDRAACAAPTPRSLTLVAFATCSATTPPKSRR